MIPETLNYGPFLSWLEESPMSHWGESLPELLAQQLRRERWGDMPEWEETLKRLPEIDPLTIELKDQVSIGDPSLMDKGRRLALQATLMGLHPWRKGPFNLFGMQLNTEWRSDWKWDRVLPHQGLSIFLACSSIPSGVQTGNGIVSCPIWIPWKIAWYSMWVAAMVTTAGVCSALAPNG